MLKSKLLGLVALVVAGFYLFTDPTGAAATVKNVFGAAGQFLGALTN